VTIRIESAWDKPRPISHLSHHTVYPECFTQVIRGKKESSLTNVARQERLVLEGGRESDSRRIEKLRWRRLLRTVRHWFPNNKVLVWVQINELPNRLAPGKLYLLGEGTCLWALAMRCPCGCGDSIHINLLPDACPCWQLTHHSNGTVSLHPAIWRQSSCGSYFFIRGSRVYWWNREALDHRKFSADIAASFLQTSELQSKQSSVSSATSRSAQTRT